jgi:transposase
MTFVLTGGERNEQIAVPALLDRGHVRRRRGGRPRLRPRRTAGDKGYSSETVRRHLRQRRIGAIIPTRSDQRRRPRFDRAAYRERNGVERLIGRLKQFRAIATRYDKLGAMFHAGLTVVAILLWLSFRLCSQGLDQLQASRPGKRFGTVTDAELAVDVVGVGLDRAHGDDQLLSDLPV